MEQTFNFMSRDEDKENTIKTKTTLKMTLLSAYCHGKLLRKRRQVTKGELFCKLQYYKIQS
jgi:hypothetical protein